MVWACRQDHLESTFRRIWTKIYVLYNVFSTWFSTLAYYNIFGYRKLSQHYHVLLLWWSGTVSTMLRPLKSAVWNYIIPRINFASSTIQVFRLITKLRCLGYYIVRILEDCTKESMQRSSSSGTDRYYKWQFIRAETRRWSEMFGDQYFPWKVYQLV